MSSSTTTFPVTVVRRERDQVVRIRVAVPAADWVAVGLLIGLAALPRLPDLRTLPALSDEVREVLWSLSIARGERLPLTNYDAYDGAVFNYLLAIWLRLVGPDPFAPRVMMLALGLLTIPVVYLCVRRAHGSAAGVLAAAMLAVSPSHALVNSHVAWGNCLTPLFTTLGFWLMYRALRQPDHLAPGDHAWNLVPAGVVFGLALQTHPSVFGILPGALVAVGTMRPQLLKTRWAWLACVGFAVGYANMILFNVRHDFESIRAAQQTRFEYTGAEPVLGREYLITLGSLLMGLFRMIGGAVEERGADQAFLTDPLLVASAALVVCGVIWSSRRGDHLPLLVTLSLVLLLPLVNDRYHPLREGRYLMPMLPLLYGACARLLVDFWQIGRGRTVRAAVPRAIGAALLATSLLAPLVGLSRYKQQYNGEAMRSIQLWRVLELVKGQRPLDTVVILDKDLRSTDLGAGSTELLAFEYAFTMENVPHDVFRVTPGKLEAALVAPFGEERLVVMERAKRKRLDSRFRIRHVEDRPPTPGAQPSAYGVFLVSLTGPR